MSSAAIKGAAGYIPDQAIERIGKHAGADAGAEKARLKKATREFESLVIYEMLKTMRKTVPESAFSKDAPLAGGMGKDIFTQMFDMKLAQKVATGGKSSISDILYSQMEKLVEAQYGAGDEEVEIKPLGKAEKSATELRPHNFIEVPGRFKQVQEKELNPSLRALDSNNPDKTVRDITRNYGRYIRRAAHKNDLDSALILSVIKVESGGRASAVSPAGAKGLMQLADSTAQQYGVTKVFDPRQNIEAGSQYLRDLIDRFGDLKLALAAYNAGPGNVDKYGGLPPFRETEAYVDNVIKNMTALTDTNAKPES
jgi:Rod binding domain-containing protein